MKVFYSPNQNVVDNTSFSPSAGKPARVLRNWLDLGLNVDVADPLPCSVSDLCLAHDPLYVKGVLNLLMKNGFSNKLESIAASLPWTTGSFVSAALWAYQNKKSCVSLTSGFHHAHYESGGGFCTFNGLMVAAMKLRGLPEWSGRIGILDLDMHYGDGTAEIMTTLDLKNNHIEHYSFGQKPLYPEYADRWLEELPNILESFKDCKIILYQAGADPHIEDPLGGSLTTDQMYVRDMIVFEWCRDNKIPVVWNLAGGYQEDFNVLLGLHANTARAHLKVFEG